jgi:hypothetical protein
MNIDDDIMDRVKRCAREFVEKKWPDEAPYFPIAWEAYERALQGDSSSMHRPPTVRDSRRSVVGNLKGPTVRNTNRLTVRLEDDTIIMGPRVIRAFHILFTMMAERTESENSETLKQEMLQQLSQGKFSPEFSREIVDFFVENR